VQVKGEFVGLFSADRFVLVSNYGVAIRVG
jgi:hypothetical protein